MTEPGAQFEQVLPPEQVEELLRTLVKASRAFQMYLPNNPMFHRAAKNLETAFEPVWSAVDELVLTVQETDFVWEGTVVYHQLSKADSLAWTLYKDGLRVLTLRKGVEVEELAAPAARGEQGPRAQRRTPPRTCSPSCGPRSFSYVDVRFTEFVQDFGTAELVPGAQYSAGASFADEVKTDLAGAGPGEGIGGVAAQGETVAEGEEAGAAGEAGGAVDAVDRPKGVVDIDEFDSTLYFLDAGEIDMLSADLQLEYTRDLRDASLSALYDLFESYAEDEVREEILGVLETLFPSMLNAGEFRASAAVLRETRALAERAPGLSAGARERLVKFIAQLSEPAIVSQLMQALDEGTGRPSDADIVELLRELRPGALSTLVEWTPRLTSAPVRALVEAAVQQLASAHQGELLRLLRSGDPEALPGAIDLAGRLKLEGAVAGLGDVMGRADAGLRLAATEALVQIGTPGALVLLEKAIGDDDRGGAGRRAEGAERPRVQGRAPARRGGRRGQGPQGPRLQRAARVLRGVRRHRGADRRLAVLGDLLVRRGFFRRKQSADVRMCAALGLGKIGSPEARAVLESVAEDNDRQVRNAVAAALRGVAE